MLDFILRLGVISLLEESFLVLSAIVILRNFELLKKENFPKIAMLIFISALNTNIIRIFKINDVVNLCICFVTIFIAIKVFTKKSFVKVIVSVSMPYVVFLLTEGISVLFISFATNHTLNEVTSDISSAIIASFIERIIQFSILYLVYRRRLGKYSRSVDGNDAIDFILLSKSLRTVAAMILCGNVYFLVWIIYSIYIEKTFANASLNCTLTAIIAMIITPICSIVGLLEISHRTLASCNAYTSAIKKDILCKIIEAKNKAQKNKEYNSVNELEEIINSFDL